MTPSLVSRILLYWSAIGTFLVIAAALISPVVLVGSLIAPLLLCDRALLMEELRKVRPMPLILLVTALYLAVNASWSLDMKNAYISVATVFILALVAHVGVSALSLCPPAHLDTMRRGAVLGIAVGAAFLTFEYITRMSLQRGLQALLAHANVSMLRVKAGPADAQILHLMNRNLVALVMLAWIACLLQFRLDASRRGRLFAALLLAVVAIAALLSPSATAKIGLLGGAALFVLQYFAPRIALPLLTAAWVALCAFVVPMAHYLYKLRLYEAPWLFSSARHRIVIWGATSDWYWKTPWFGAGVGSARGIDPLDPAHRVTASGLETAALNWHSHNAFLQVWFEAGAVGALLMLGIGLIVLRAISRADVESRPLLVAAFTSSILMAATAFSIWAAWYLAAFGVVAILAVLATTHGTVGRTQATGARVA